MTFKEMMAGNIQFNQGSALLQPVGRNTRKVESASGQTLFADILGSRTGSSFGKNTVKLNSGSIQENSKSNSVYSEKRPEYLTFREANERNAAASPIKSTGGNKTKLNGKNGPQKNEQVDDCEAEVKDQRPGNMLQIFAQVMGIGVGDLQKLLKEAGITSEAFNNMKNAEENALKLSQILGLNSEQQDTLAELLELAGEIFEKAAEVQAGLTSPGTIITGGTYEQAESTAEAASQQLNPEAEPAGNKMEAYAGKMSGQTDDASVQGTKSGDGSLKFFFEEVSIKIKMKLSGVKADLKADSGGLGGIKEEISQLMQSLQDNTSAAVEDALNPQDSSNPVESAGEGTVSAEKTEKADKGTEQHDAGKGSNTNTDAAAAHKAEANEQPQSQEAFVTLQTEKIKVSDAVEKSSLNRQAASKEIIGQVIEKAKVILTSDKSEMVMDLKPESLGRISLKVVTENGIVMAKFVAENQQVRQVLEANMQLLKESLEKQGMNVQGFSVSVRQDSRRSDGNHQEPESGRNRSITGAVYQSDIMTADVHGIFEAKAGSNPFHWGGSKINLTA